MFQFHETQSFPDALLDLVFWNITFFEQSERHVLADGEGVKECAFLEHNPDPPPQFKQILFFHLCNVLPQGVNVPAIGADESQR
jgi:hypothetical protein